MNKLIRLSKTGIEYGDYAWNFASGCGNQIDGKCNSGGFRCWAYSITQRFGGHYPNGFKPTIYPEALLSPLYLEKPSRILCVFMGDLFWDCPEFNPDKKLHSLLPSGRASITMSLKGWIFTTIKECPQHTFLFLTKQPQNLTKFQFPDNCWVGVTATDSDLFACAVNYLMNVRAKVKFVSIEPLLRWPRLDISTWLNQIDWVIIGAQTKPYKPPKIEWVKEIVEAADKAGVKVFLKNNLMPLLENDYGDEPQPFFIYSDNDPIALRQEMPDD